MGKCKVSGEVGWRRDSYTTKYPNCGVSSGFFLLAQRFFFSSCSVREDKVLLALEEGALVDTVRISFSKKPVQQEEERREGLIPL